MSVQCSMFALGSLEFLAGSWTRCHLHTRLQNPTVTACLPKISVPFTDGFFALHLCRMSCHRGWPAFVIKFKLSRAAALAVLSEY